MVFDPLTVILDIVRVYVGRSQGGFVARGKAKPLMDGQLFTSSYP